MSIVGGFRPSIGVMVLAELFAGFLKFLSSQACSVLEVCCEGVEEADSE